MTLRHFVASTFVAALMSAGALFGITPTAGAVTPDIIDHTCKSISDGTVCVGVNDANQNYASFNNTSGGAVEGYVVLGRPGIGNSCALGTVVAQSSKQTIAANGGHISANASTGVSSYWSSSYYQKSGSSYVLAGRVCAEY